MMGFAALYPSYGTRLIEFVDTLPRNATVKIHKPTLRQQFDTVKATDKVAS